jgi:hypothetical protein
MRLFPVPGAGRPRGLEYPIFWGENTALSQGGWAQRTTQPRSVCSLLRAEQTAANETRGRPHRCTPRCPGERRTDALPAERRTDALPAQCVSPRLSRSAAGSGTPARGPLLPVGPGWCCTTGARGTGRHGGAG